MPPNAQFVKRCLAYIVEPITEIGKYCFSAKWMVMILPLHADSGCYGARKRGTTLTRNWLRGVEYGKVFWLDRS
jgi:hypothetical protein